MYRFFAGPEQFRDGKVFLATEEAYHLRKVLRLESGTMVRVFNGRGHEYQVQLTVETSGRVWGQVVAEVDVLKEPKLKVTLAQGLAKREKNELVVQKATEIGVQAVIPVACERSVVKLSRKSTREDRLRRAAREAAKQCGRAVVPVVEPACAFRDLPARFNAFDAVLLCWEQEGSTDLKQALQQLRRQPLENLLVLVGPEGGFTLAEAHTAREHGARSVSLGPRILRTETAGLVALTAILYEFDELEP